MIKSMTGFGRAVVSDAARSVTCEIRAVNHRYADITMKTPRNCGFAEEKMKAVIRETVRRGKLECRISIETIAASTVNVALDEALAEKYVGKLQELKDRFGLEGTITPGLVAGFPDVLKAVPAEEDEEELLKTLLEAVRQAAANLDAMRRVEGEKLAQDLLARGELIRGLVDKIEARAENVPEEYRERLLKRIQELLAGSGVQAPEERIAVETAVFADKCNITEEITRLRSHLDQMDSIIGESSGGDGKKLDFLIQEMNREANTIGSKANDITITNWMLEIKAEVEKIREQAQNIE